MTDGTEDQGATASYLAGMTGGNRDARRLFTVMSVRCAGAHLIGALCVFLYLGMSLGPGSTHGPVANIDLPVEIAVFLSVLAVTFAMVTVLENRSFCRACHWYLEDRLPTDEERALTLAQPWKQAVLPFVGWATAAVAYAVLAAVAGHTALHVLRMVDGIVLGGLATSALGYLLVERLFRPMFAIALAGESPDRPRTLGIRPRLLLSWAVGSGVPLLGIALAPFTHETGAPFGLGTSVAVLAVFGVVVGLLGTALAARSVADPVDGVRSAMARVQNGDLGAHVTLDDGGEIGMLQGGFNRMVAGLREREHLRDLFGRHVGDEVARHAMEAPTGLGGEQREASVLFVDLVGSTALAEVLPPEDVVATLNAFFGAVVDAVSAHGGWVNKFEGDGALCIFGAPAVQPDHAARALRAARAVRERVTNLSTAHPVLDAGVGVSSGVVVAGNVGTEQRYEYTVIGAPVNEAARLSELAKNHPARVLAAGASVERAGDETAAWLSRGTVALRGRSQPCAVYEAVDVTVPTPAP